MPGPGEAAAEAGRQWGRYLTEQPAPYQSAGADEAIARLTATMAEIGFAPEVVEDGDGYQLRLRQCPFREVAEGHQDVVCKLHLGLMRGVLEQMRAPVTADQVQPFAEPGGCIAHIAARRATPRGKKSRG
jgi:predicted ArsR family transcriptional regulator